MSRSRRRLHASPTQVGRLHGDRSRCREVVALKRVFVHLPIGISTHEQVAVAAGDVAHEPANKDMRGRWKHPIKGMGWYKDTKKASAALPED